MFSIYVHVPFCLKKCSYCDFHSVASKPEDVPQKEFVAALCRKADIQSKKYGLEEREIGSIYLGGGTPTMLSPKSLEQLLNHLSTTFKLSPEIELSIEANPETLTRPSTALGTCSLTYMLAHLFNRVSVGIQTFSDIQLKKLGRVHDSKTAEKAILSLQEAGCKNISIDLMWGLPGQTVDELQDDLDRAIALGPQHISAYQLTTDRFSDLPSEELSREMWLLAHNKLTSAGFGHYEISNFAKMTSSNSQAHALTHLRASPFRCRHNLNYWHYGEWLGLGPSATGQTGNRRFTVKDDIKKYLISDLEYTIEEIDDGTAFKEYCFMGLRTSDGIEFESFNARHPGLTEKWISKGLAQLNHSGASTFLRLTPDGWLISDTLFSVII